MGFINANLITLKCVIFLFFGAVGSLLPFLPLHMNSIGLSRDESVIISVVAPLIAVLGPLIAAPLADRWGGGFSGSPKNSKSGRYLRFMLAFCFLLATIFYWLLIFIPPIIRSPPNVTFMCDEQGGYILQDRCGSDNTCYNWNGDSGSVLVKNCKFACKVTTSWKNEITTTEEPMITDDTTSASQYPDYPYDDLNNSGDYQPPPEAEINHSARLTEISLALVPHPHMCHKNGSSSNYICDVYTEYSLPIDLKLSLKPSVSQPDPDEEEITPCKYPFGEPFHCRIPADVTANLTYADPDCNPVIACEIHWPYNNTNSLLRVSQCGYNNIFYYLYLFIRSIADIFTAAAVALIGAIVVIATRETSTGRGDVGKQFAAGALALAIFPAIIGGAANGEFLPAMICFTVLMVIAIIILLVDGKMPLSPPEWWWHTRCGLLALPMSSVRKYGIETIALGIILFLLGLYWNAIDAFLAWHVVKLTKGTALLIGLTFTIGALPAVLYLVFAEKIVDYFGHNNILILCFTTYIIHHIALIQFEEAPLVLICEFLEVFTLHLMWITAVLYLRHLVPRKFTACAQALPVIAHFCLGRCIGALIGGLAYTDYPESFQNVHMWFAISATIVAILYFAAYHFYLKYYCLAPTQLPPYPAPSVVQSVNGNGSYTPLRVYHNSSSKKGHFRY